VQKHSRRLAVLETMDNGKPIRESRDIDIPLVARHFYHHAGWAQLLEQEFPQYTGLRRGRPGDSVEFSAADVCVEGGSGAGRGQHGGHQAGKIYAAHRAGLCRAGDGSGPAAGRAERAHLRCKDGPGAHRASGHRQGCVYRIDRSGPHDSQGHGELTKKLSLELGGKSPFVVFDDADLDSAVEGLVDAIWFNQGQVCCAGSRLLVQERVAETLYTKIRARMETLRVGPPLDKAIDIGAIVSPVQLESIRKMVDAGVAEGRQVLAAEQSSAGEGLLLPADAAHRRASGGDGGAGRDLSARCWSP
jgi:aldehyde dehydrogenase (NAD+)